MSHYKAMTLAGVASLVCVPANLLLHAYGQATTPTAAVMLMVNISTLALSCAYLLGRYMGGRED